MVGFQIKTVVRLMIVVIIAGIAATLFVEQRADAADAGYGVTSDPWHDASLVEGRLGVTMPMRR